MKIKTPSLDHLLAEASSLQGPVTLRVFSSLFVSVYPAQKLKNQHPKYMNKQNKII